VALVKDKEGLENRIKEFISEIGRFPLKPEIRPLYKYIKEFHYSYEDMFYEMAKEDEFIADNYLLVMLKPIAHRNGTKRLVPTPEQFENQAPDKYKRILNRYYEGGYSQFIQEQNIREKELVNQVIKEKLQIE
jgi:hypothetical protein